MLVIYIINLIRLQYLENIILTKIFLLSTCPTTSVMSKLTIPNDRAKFQYAIVHKVSVIFFEDDRKLDPYYKLLLQSSFSSFNHYTSQINLCSTVCDNNV